MQFDLMEQWVLLNYLLLPEFVDLYYYILIQLNMLSLLHLISQQIDKLDQFYNIPTIFDMNLKFFFNKLYFYLHLVYLDLYLSLSLHLLMLILIDWLPKKLVILFQIIEFHGETFLLLLIDIQFLFHNWLD